MPIEINLHQGKEWVSGESATVVGSVFIDNSTTCWNSNKILREINKCKSIKTFITLVKRFKGHFAIVYTIEGKLVLAVDHIRSYPLFYKADGSAVADTANGILSDIDRSDFEVLTEVEYLLTTYITGSDTLVKELKQVEAGQIVIIDEDTYEINTKQYYSYEPKDGKGTLNDLEQAIELSIKRLCEFANGRPIYLLLSGGCDSQLILAKLIKEKYESLHCISFGKPNYSDVTKARKIAKSVNIDWIFVEYNKQVWKDWFNSQEREEYYSMSHNLDSLPALHQGPAISYLLDKGRIEEDGVFVAGQTIASIGEHLFTSNLREMNREKIVQHVFKNHYKLWKVEDDLAEMLISRINTNLMKTDNTEESLNSAYENWEWKERQSKYMSQDSLIYLFYGYDWWFPLFDKDLMEVWGKLPIKMRRNKVAFKEIKYEAFSLLSNDSEFVFAMKNINSRFVRNFIRQRVIGSPFEEVLRNFIRKFKKNKSAEGPTNPLAYFGMMNETQPGKYYSGRETHHSYRVMHATGRMSFNPPNNSGMPADCIISSSNV